VGKAKSKEKKAEELVKTAIRELDESPHKQTTGREDAGTDTLPEIERVE
jgi:hypothetical protein